MKRTFLVLIAILSFTACSDDDENNNSLNELQTQLLGKWYFGNPQIVGLETNNSFTFNSEGQVTYSYWSGGADFDFFTEEGTYSFDGDIMTMVYPEDVVLTFVQKVVFINNNVVEFQDTGVSGENAYEGDYFREGAISYESPDGTLKEYQISLLGSSSSSQSYPLTIEYYVDDENGQISTQIVNSQTGTDVIESIFIESVDKIGFKYDVTGYEDTVIGGVEIRNVETDTYIFSESSLQIEDNQVFIYDISDNSYTIE